jgi:hypothetical protein
MLLQSNSKICQNLEHLCKKNFELLESIKSRFLKRLLCLHISTKSRLVYPLVDTLFFVEEIQSQFNLNKTVQYQEFIASQYAKIAEISPDFYKTHAFKTDRWKESLHENRHLFTRYAAHGFHYHFCKNKEYHFFALDSCVYSLCNKPCSQYHLESCEKREHPLSFYAKIPSRSSYKNIYVKSEMSEIYSDSKMKIMDLKIIDIRIKLLFSSFNEYTCMCSVK